MNPARFRRRMALILGCALALGVLPETSAANRLIDSGSPYLLQHAHNPVDWYPWGPEALDKARRENKPIFVSVGYSACYWCHVANRTLYQNPEIAARMNAWFVNIKIDREQRPDLDRAFMEATWILAGSAGWPNNVFLTPGLEPFFAGSYFPPVPDDFGRPGFAQILERIHRDWTERREQLVAKGRDVVSDLRLTRSTAATAPLEPERWRREARESWLGRIDFRHGGFLGPGDAKFPHSPALALLLAEQGAEPSRPSLEPVCATLDAMAAGGIHDHLGGGFHRYTVEASWSVPHFEKMLHDNAQLLALYARAHAATGAPPYRRVAEGIAAHLARDMQAPEGGWYTALDAASAGEEGGGYLWRREEIENRLGPERARRFFEVFVLHPVAPREQDGIDGEVRGVLRMRTHAPLPAQIESARAELFALRGQRPAPARDEKQVVALNGLAIAAHAVAGSLLGRPDWIASARRAADRLWRIAWDQRRGRLAHELWRGRAQGEGLLEDYAHFARGLLALAAAGGEARWRARAEALIDAAMQAFVGEDGRLYASREAARLPLPLIDAEDYVYPSGTSATVEVLLALGDERHLAAASRLLRSLSGRLAQAPQRWPALLAALAEHPEAARVALAHPRGLPGPGAGGSPGAHDSAGRVTVTGTVRTRDDADVLEVSLRVQRGWHVNANPASLETLVPTRLLIENAVPRRIVYPPGAPFRARFAPEEIRVYQGDVAIRAEFLAGGTAALRARVSVQACSDQECLAPAVLPIRLR
jgi:hypothetical protein